MARRPSCYASSRLWCVHLFVFDSLLPGTLFVGEIMDLYARTQALLLQARLQKAEARIKELEAGAEETARTLDAVYTTIEKLVGTVERLSTDIKDLGYTVWENSNGWDI